MNWRQAQTMHTEGGEQAAAGCQMILKLFGTVSTNPLLPIPPPVGKFSDADGVAWLKVIE